MEHVASKTDLDMLRQEVGILSERVTAAETALPNLLKAADNAHAKQLKTAESVLSKQLDAAEKSLEAQMASSRARLDQALADQVCVVGGWLICASSYGPLFEAYRSVACWIHKRCSNTIERVYTVVVCRFYS